MLAQDPRLPIVSDGIDYLRSLNLRLSDLFRRFAYEINKSAMWEYESDSIPTSGNHKRGEKVKHSAPVEAGSGGSKYVVIGWVCTDSGNPGTWLEMRVLTGN